VCKLPASEDTAIDQLRNFKNLLAELLADFADDAVCDDVHMEHTCSNTVALTVHNCK
jgi:hypothetical protein